MFYYRRQESSCLSLFYLWCTQGGSSLLLTAFCAFGLPQPTKHDRKQPLKDIVQLPQIYPIQLLGSVENTAWNQSLHMRSPSPTVIFNLLKYYNNMREQQSLMIGQVLATFVIQSFGKQQTLEGIRSGQHMKVSTSYTRESSIPVTDCFLLVALVKSSWLSTAGLNTSRARTHSSFLVSRPICFIKSILLILASHICVTEYNTKYGYIFPLTYLKETAWGWKQDFLTPMPKI